MAELITSQTARVNLIAPHNSPTDMKLRKTEESKDGSDLPQVVESGLELRWPDFKTFTHCIILPLQHNML